LNQSEVEQVVFTARGVAGLLGLHPETVRRWIREGNLKGAKIGREGKYRISKSDLEDFWRKRGGARLFSDSEQRNDG